jgi:uncharacterized protein (DUF1697 family)
MTTFVALLRAVNVGGQNRVPMAALRSSLAAAGLQDVRTYVQSGNVVFAADGAAAKQAALVHDTITAEFGADVQVLALTAADLAQVAAKNPYAAGGAEARALHVTFLFAPVTAAGFAGLTLPARDGEQAQLGDDRVIYLHLPHGYGTSKLTNPWFERALKTPATTRNWRTVLTLHELATGE